MYKKILCNILVLVFYLGLVINVQGKTNEVAMNKGKKLIPLFSQKENFKKSVKQIKKTKNSEEAAEIIGLKANSGLGYTRIVLEMKEKPHYWDVFYDKENNTLNLTLPNTKNSIVRPTIKNSKNAILSGITMEEYKNGNMKLIFAAHQSVQHNLFVLENPNRIVVDLFTNYSQKINKTINDNMQLIRWNRSITAGRIHIYTVEANSDINFQRISEEKDQTLKQWKQNISTGVIVPIDGSVLTSALESTKKEIKNAYLLKGDHGWEIKFTNKNDGALIIPGAPVLKDGEYIGPKTRDGEYTRPTSTYLGVDKKGNLFLSIFEGGIPSSVGASLHEAVKILRGMGIMDAVCVARGKRAIMLVGGDILPEENTGYTIESKEVLILQ